MTDTSAPETTHGITTATERTQELLDDRYLTDCRQYIAEFIEWMLTVGKDPQRADGYSEDTTELPVYKLEKYHQWIWTDQGDGHTLRFTHDHADEYTYELRRKDARNFLFKETPNNWSASSTILIYSNCTNISR